MQKGKEKVSLTLDSEVIAEARQRAYENDRSLSQYVNIVLRDYMQRQNDLDRMMVREQPSNKPYMPYMPHRLS